MFRKSMVGVALCAVIVAPQFADARASRGVVVKRDAAHRTVVVAIAGKLRTLKVAKTFRTGTVVRVAGGRVRAVGHARSARIRGLVMRRSGARFDLSANGQVVRIASRRHHRVGDAIDVNVAVSGTGLTETSSDDAAEVEDGELVGTVTAAAAGTLELTMGMAPTTTTLSIGYDPALDLSGLVGKPVQVTVSVTGADYGTPVYTLLKIEVDDQVTGTCDDEGDDGDSQGGDGGHGQGGDPGQGGGNGGDDLSARHRDGGSDGENDDNSASNGCTGT